MLTTILSGYLSTKEPTTDSVRPVYKSRKRLVSVCSLSKFVSVKVRGREIGINARAPPRVLSSLQSPRTTPSVLSRLDATRQANKPTRVNLII